LFFIGTPCKELSRFSGDRSQRQAGLAAKSKATAKKNLSTSTADVQRLLLVLRKHFFLLLLLTPAAKYRSLHLQSWQYRTKCVSPASPPLYSVAILRHWRRWRHWWCVCYIFYARTELILTLVRRCERPGSGQAAVLVDAVQRCHLALLLIWPAIQAYQPQSTIHNI